MKKIIIIFILILSGFGLSAQFDTEFWFAPPYANRAHDSNNEYRFVISTSNTPSSITITQPNNTSFVPITFDITANSSHIATISEAAANVYQSDNNSNRGFKIIASNPVFCYYEVYTNPINNIWNTELFSLKGKNALGTDFFIPMQNYLKNDNPNNAQCYSYFSIVATENNTTVSITPTKALVGHLANTAFDVTLNIGEFYTARSQGFAALDHPAGSRVVSDKKVAITYYDDSMNGQPFGGCGDIGGDQIVPTSLLGNTYVAIQGFLNSLYDPVFILATEDNTQIFINSVGTPVATINTGETYKYQFNTNPFTNSPNSAVYIMTTNPVYVSQVSGFGCEVGYSILPTMDCRGSRSVSVTRSQGDSYYLTLVTSSDHVGNFTFNGVSTVITAADFLSVPGTDGAFKFARKLLSTSDLSVGASALIENSTGDFHLGVINGGAGNTCKFGYFSDFAKYAIVGSNLSGDTICAGDSIVFEISNSNNGFFTWTHLESNTILQGPTVSKTFKIFNANPENSGTYIIEGFFGLCEVQSDTLKVVVLPSPKAEFSAVTNCVNNPTSFENLSTGAETYHWDFGDENQSTQSDPTHTYILDGDFDVQLIATSSFGCVDTILNNIEIIPGIQVYDTASFCPNGTYQFYDKTLSISGNYEHFIDGQDCDTTIHLRLDQIEANVTITQEPLDFCEDYQATLLAVSEFTNFRWNTGETSPQIVVHLEGIYTVTVSEENCSLTKSFKIAPCEHFIYLPNTITPGKLGLNDVFKLQSNIIPLIVEFELFVFDRWGRVVYSTIDPAFVWDGRVGGKVVSNSVFSYRMRVRFDKSKMKQIVGKINVL